MDWSNNNVSLSGYLYGKFIEEAVSNGPAFYRPSYLVANRWAYELKKPNLEKKDKPSYFICVKLAGAAVVRIRLPRWVSVHVMSS
jgi:hypothetical protein